MWQLVLACDIQRLTKEIDRSSSSGTGSFTILSLKNLEAVDVA